MEGYFSSPPSLTENSTEVSLVFRLSLQAAPLRVLVYKVCMNSFCLSLANRLSEKNRSLNLLVELAKLVELSFLVIIPFRGDRGSECASVGFLPFCIVGQVHEFNVVINTNHDKLISSFEKASHCD